MGHTTQIDGVQRKLKSGYTLVDGVQRKPKKGLTLVEGVQRILKFGPKNQVPISTDTDGSIYNGVGYKDNTRVRSGGEEGANNRAACTGFIPVSAGDVVRFSGMPWFADAASANALNAANASYENIGQFTMLQNARYGIFSSSYSAYAASSVVEETTGVWRWIVPPAASGVAYIRISAFDASSKTKGADMIVTINEEI